MAYWKRSGLLALFLLLIVVRPAAAHGYIVRAIPEDRATLDYSPTRLQYWFSEGLETNFSGITVRNQAGEVVAVGGVAHDNNTLMVVRLPETLPDGAYIIELRPAFASDGHVIVQSYVLFIGESASDIQGTTAPTTAEPLEVVWRTIVLASTILLFGTFTLYSTVLVPAWGNKQHRAGLLPPRVMRRLNRVIWAGLSLALLGNLLALLQQTMVFFNTTDIGQIFAQNYFEIVLSGSRFGDFWKPRLVFLAIVALVHYASIYLRESQPETVRPFWVANAWLVALILGTFTAVSHAAGALLWTWAAMAVDWLHLTAVAFWVGGLMALILVLPVALQPYDGETRFAVLGTAMRRYSGLVLRVVVMVIVSGIFSALLWFYQPSEVVETHYGQALLLKGLLVALLLVIGALHHIALRPQLLERVPGMIRGGANRVGQFGRSLQLEVLVAIVVLAAVGLLSATPIPEPDFIQQDIETLFATQTVNGLDITLTITPGGPGVNTFDTVIERDGERPTDLTVTMQVVQPSRDWRSSTETLERVNGDFYVTAAAAIDRTGEWWTLLDITEADGTVTRAAFDWAISEDATIIRNRPATILHGLAGIAVIGAIVVAFFPELKRWYHTLDKGAMTLTVAGMAIGLSIFVMVITANIIHQQGIAYEQRLSPPPQIINPTLPDAASLARGAALYAEVCATWPESDEYDVFLNNIRVLRDEDLFAIIAEGWRDLPPCTGNLTDNQRWDIVNHLRTIPPVPLIAGENT